MATFKNVVKFSSNILVENLAMRVGFLATSMIAARLGTDQFAAHNVGMNLMSLGFSLYFEAEHIIAYGVLISRYIMVIVLLQISQIIYGACLRAAGDIKYTLLASLISVTFIRAISTYILTTVFHLGLHGIWLGIFAD